MRSPLVLRPNSPLGFGMVISSRLRVRDDEEQLVSVFEDDSDAIDALFCCWAMNNAYCSAGRSELPMTTNDVLSKGNTLCNLHHAISCIWGRSAHGRRRDEGGRVQIWTLPLFQFRLMGTSRKSRKEKKQGPPTAHEVKKNQTTVARMHFMQCWCQGEGVGCGGTFAYSTRMRHKAEEKKKRLEGGFFLHLIVYWYR
jgi:hypothetical protein